MWNLRFVAATCLFVSASGAIGDITLDRAASFGVLGLDGVKISMSHANSGTSGDLGLGPNGEQNFSNGRILGDYLIDPTADDGHSNNVIVSGATRVEDLTGPIADALAASAEAASMAPDQTFGDITDATTIAGTGGTNVISVDSISFSGSDDVLTLTGGRTDVFIINVQSTVKLSHGQSAIRVAGDVSPQRVLFNVLGDSDPVKFSGGASAVGTFLAVNGKITLSPGTIFGAIIAGDDISLPSGGFVHHRGFRGTPCPADFNNDGVVDSSDVIAFLNAYVNEDPAADLDGDTKIDTKDVLKFLNAWNMGC